MKAAVGFRAHSGWAAMVVVALEKSGPVVLWRKRPHLVKIFSYSYRQPYHTAEKMELAEAREFVAGVEKESRELAFGAIRGLQGELRKQGIELTRCGLLLASGRTLPSFEKILASHALIHTADGDHFREAISCAAKRCGLEMATMKERELLERAVQTLRMQPAMLLRRITELGKPFGAPWSQDEKFAALAAWLAMHGDSKPRK
ncbi:MAG TPA: hypothetical protein VKB90_14590 [Candidatus Acidoferrum sp.]|nr:hypothetical protein [Candidatus Acidoferrum sp.]